MVSIQKEDVYESEDLPEADRNNFDRDEINDPEHIELIHVDIDEAKKRFAGKVLNLRNVDYSDSVAKKKRTGGNSSYVLEVIGKSYGEPETIEQKFNRLTCEISELAAQVKAAESSEAVAAVPEAAVNLLLEELKGARAGELVSETGTGKSSASASAATSAKTPSSDETSQDLILEQRLRRLEAIIGPLEHCSQPLIDDLEDLKLRIESLNPNFVDGVETKLNQVLTKLQQAEGKKDQSGDETNFESKVNELLELMKKWDVSCSNLPSNVKKVQALHKLHEQARQFSERLTHVVGVRDNLEKALASDRETLRDLQFRAKNDMDNLLKQVETLGKRVDSLSK